MSVQASKLKVGAIIQARMSSVRLPGKILMPLPFNSGKPVLEWIIDSLKKSSFIEKVVIATSLQKENNILEEVALKNEVIFFAGSENDVLSRFTAVAVQEGIDVIVRITADNAIVDTNLLDDLIKKHIQSGNDCTHSVNLPLGMNFEIVNTSVLLKIEKEGSLSAAHREHVTSFIYDNNSFKTELVPQSANDYTDRIRLTLDYPADYAVLSFVADIANKENLEGMELVKYIDKHYNWIFEINKNQLQKQHYKNSSEEVNAAAAILNNLDLKRAAQILSANNNG